MGCPAAAYASARAHGGQMPARVESLALRHFFGKKMADEDASLLLTVPSGTTSLKTEVFFLATA